MCGEDSRHINSSLFGQGKSHSGQPFMKMSNDGLFLFMRDKLWQSQQASRSSARYRATRKYLAQEPCHEVSKNHRFICLIISRRRRNPRGVPEISFPLVQPPIASLGVNEKNPWSTFYQPPSIHQPDASRLHVCN